MLCLAPSALLPRRGGYIYQRYRNVAVHDHQEARLRIKARVRSGWRTAKFKATPAPIEIPPITTLDRFKQSRRLVMSSVSEFNLRNWRSPSGLVVPCPRRVAGCSEEERAKLVALVRALQTLITRISHFLSRRDRLPEIIEQILQILKPQSERLEIEFKQMLDALAECFRQGDCRVQLPTVRGALSEMDDAIQQIRDRNMLADLPLEAPLRVLELVERYHATGEALEECGRLVRTLEIQRYWGDYAL